MERDRETERKKKKEGGEREREKRGSEKRAYSLNLFTWSCQTIYISKR